MQNTQLGLLFVSIKYPYHGTVIRYISVLDSADTAHALGLGKIVGPTLP